MLDAMEKGIAEWCAEMGIELDESILLNRLVCLMRLCHVRCVEILLFLQLNGLYDWQKRWNISPNSLAQSLHTQQTFTSGMPVC